MPNLRAIIDGMVLNLSPDIYLRDFVGDNGDPHLGAISSSPDIILRPMAVPDPQAAFGAGSGTENDVTLGYEAESGQDNFVYVRVRNRGGTAASSVAATVYWAPPSTLLTPDLWTLLGTAMLPTVPTGDLLTVSDTIVWPAAAIPAPGHYCFVSILNTPRDPGPTPADLMDWNNFTTFIRSNNNVTWPCPSSRRVHRTGAAACSLRSCRGSLPALKSCSNCPRNSPSGCGYAHIT